jgi:hypothetical protein
MLLDTPVCDFGWKAPDFTLKDPDGVVHTMTSLSSVTTALTSKRSETGWRRTRAH